MWTNTEQELINGVLKHGPNILEHCLTTDDISKYLQRVDAERLNYPIPPTDINPKHWFIPDDYCPDLVEILFDMCKTDEQKERVNQELDVLYTMKYIVDTLRANNVVWGVGRGSSVASYVLYLIGVHKIDSIKYNLPIEEFFKEK